MCFYRKLSTNRDLTAIEIVENCLPYNSFIQFQNEQQKILFKLEIVSQIVKLLNWALMDQCPSFKSTINTDCLTSLKFYWIDSAFRSYWNFPQDLVSIQSKPVAEHKYVGNTKLIDSAQNVLYKKYARKKFPATTNNSVPRHSCVSKEFLLSIFSFFFQKTYPFVCPCCLESMA